MTMFASSSFAYDIGRSRAGDCSICKFQRSKYLLDFSFFFSFFLSLFIFSNQKRRIKKLFFFGNKIIIAGRGNEKKILYIEKKKF